MTHLSSSAPEKTTSPRRAVVKPRVAKAVPEAKPTKPTKHGQEINRLLKKLSEFEWDEEAMKRA